MFFLCGLRQVHNAFHYAVGVSKRGHEWLMFILSPLMMSAMHAVQFCHLRHHRHCMDDDDVEAMSARMPGWQALLLGPKFPFMLHKTALQHGAAATPCAGSSSSSPRWPAMAMFAFGVVDWTFLRYHVVAMTVGQCFSAFFAVWTVHHDCDREHYIARTHPQPAEGLRHVRHVLSRRAPPLPDGADLPPARCSPSASTRWRRS